MWQGRTRRAKRCSLKKSSSSRRSSNSSFHSGLAACLATRVVPTHLSSTSTHDQGKTESFNGTGHLARVTRIRSTSATVTACLTGESESPTNTRGVCVHGKHTFDSEKRRAPRGTPMISCHLGPLLTNSLSKITDTKYSKCWSQLGEEVRHSFSVFPIFCCATIALQYALACSSKCLARYTCVFNDSIDSCVVLDSYLGLVSLVSDSADGESFEEPLDTCAYV